MGHIFNIQKFCTSDGPGIRTTVFMKGCPLSCAWCHNPESQAIEPRLLYSAEKCLNCLRCTAVCDCHKNAVGVHVFEREDCISCGKCTKLKCPALELAGYEITPDEVIADVMKDKLFYDNSGGGMTLSGGEPFAQPEFMLALLRLAKEKGLHVCVETCGFAGSELIKKAAEYIDLFLFDFKVTSPERHRELTGVDNAKILENLHLIDSLGKKIILRCPIIPGCNDDDAHLSGIAALANSLRNLQRIELEPYHALGESKYDRLGREYSLSGIKSPESATVDAWLEYIRSRTDIEVAKA